MLLKGSERSAKAVSCHVWGPRRTHGLQELNEVLWSWRFGDGDRGWDWELGLDLGAGAGRWGLGVGIGGRTEAWGSAGRKGLAWRSGHLPSPVSNQRPGEPEQVSPAAPVP